MGLGGFIVSGAVGGAGQGANGYFDTQQKLQGQYANAANLAQLNAGLDVQKQASLLALQQQMKMNMLDRLSQDDGQSAPQAPAQATQPTAAPVPQVSGLDMSKVTPQQLAMMQKDPKFAEGLRNGVADFNATSAAQNSAMSMPPAVSYRPGAAPIWSPSRQQMKAALTADLFVPGSGAKVLETNAPTEQMKNDQWAGITPAQRNAIAGKVEMRPNQTIGSFDANGNFVPQYVAADPDSNAQYAMGPNGQISASGVSGLPQAHADLAQTKQNAINQATMAPTSASQVDAHGRVIPTTVADALSSGKGAGLAPGQETAAETSQKDLATKWGKLNDANSGAQTTLSYLQNIKSLAAKTQTGQFADRLQYINSLLSLVGDSKATDEASARNLLDKYKGQIVAKLGGSGGMSTDAGRAIIDSAYPGAHMTNAAINEAVDNLAGAMNMTKAKATFLQPYYANKDANGYQQNETAFDQNADPRIWQWQAIQDPRQRAAFAQSLMRQDPTIGQKIHNLESIGAIK